MHRLRKVNVLSRLVVGFVLSLGLAGHTMAQTSASDAAAIATAQTGGKVLRVKERKVGNYRVKVLMPNGQVRHIIVGKPKSPSKN
jgi:hypothetical protein